MFYNFTALAAGLPFLPPYLDQDESVICNHGENFAVAGATALPADVLAKRNISFAPTKYNLNVQLDWMSTYFNGICHNAEG